MRILIIGLPYFSSKIAAQLSDVDVENKYISLDTSGSFIDKIKFLFNILFTDVLYQIGGSVEVGGALRVALLLRRKIVFHWVGTDVLIAQDYASRGILNRKFLSMIRHLCEVEWIQNELSEIKIFAEIVQIACFETRQLERNVVPMPLDFSVLSYVGKGKESFYGFNKIISVAKCYSDVHFRIAGIEKYNVDLPPNVKLLGWVKDMAAEYNKCSLYLRLPEHDGLAFSVLEALSYGRYVGYSNDLEATFFVSDLKALSDLIEKLKLLSDKHQLEVNIEGINFIKNNYSKDKCMKELITYLK